MEFNDSIEKLNSVGAVRAAKLHKLGIYRLIDILEYFPRDYDDRSTISTISTLEIDKENTFIAAVYSEAENLYISDKIITKLKLKDNTGIIMAIWYNQPYIKNSLTIGSKYIFTGKVYSKYNKLEIYSPEFEKLDGRESLSTGRIVPIYSTTDKISQKMFRQLVKSTLDNVDLCMSEFLPYNICEKYKLIDRNTAIYNIHFPKNEIMFFKARYRLAFEELFLLQFGIIRIKMLNNINEDGIIIKLNNDENLIELPFTLTNSQKKALAEIKANMTSGKIMNRLIQGDVGSGKTIVALLSAFIVVKNGYQVAMMAPTEILAKQHFESFKAYLSKFNVNIVLLTGSMTRRQKNDIINQIKSGDANIILGTHSLIQENVEYNNLGLIITDEQHRFGVKQRIELSKKGQNPHMIVMTATPIPRTLALVLYGDLDITSINELPPGRQRIETFAVNTSYYERIYKFIKKEISNGRQCYIICPMVSESDKYEDLKSVEEYTYKLKTDIFKEYIVEYIHGKLKAKEKEEIMNRFINGTVNILVSTTVIEVGINVPNATLMVIENAERFGLAQLHQLRGRVGRGEFKSFCILVSDSKNKITSERLRIMTKSNDGFELSEVDLNLRGPGDFFGTRQHGLPELRIANLYKDINILKAVQKAASDILESDPNLLEEQNLALKAKLKEFFKTDIDKLAL